MSKTLVAVEKRQNLYYNKYEYRAHFAVDGAGLASRSKNSDQLENWIASRLRYYDTYAPHLSHAADSLRNNHGTLDSLLKWMEKNADLIKTRAENNVLSVYAADLKTLKKLERIVPHINYTKVEPYGEPNHIFLRNPKHQYRVYLKSKRVTDFRAFGTELTEFFELHKNTLFPCSALKRWALEASDPNSNSIRQSYKFLYNWLPDNYFIDYDHESTITLLSFILDGYLKKTHKVVKREN